MQTRLLLVGLTAIQLLSLPGLCRAQVHSTPTTQFIAVDRDVKLEVIDWGGTGRPLVLLAGLSNTAHDLEEFAIRLTSTYHVYGVTRRGFYPSSIPASGYSADRLGDDVLAVLDSLRLDRPVLAGHSLAGEELSSIGSRRPDRVAGLIYLDAGYQYAFYDSTRSNYFIDRNELRQRLDQLGRARGAKETGALIEQLLQTDLPAFDRSLREALTDLPPGWRELPASARAPRYANGEPSAAIDSILAGQQRYMHIRAPVLAIYALPHRMPPTFPADSASRVQWDVHQHDQAVQADAFVRGNPTARVIRIPNADHAVFESNAGDVIREIDAFVASLPPVR